MPGASAGDFTLYGHHESEASQRVGLMLRLAGVPFAYRHVDLFAGEHKTPAFRALSRFAQVPVLLHEGTAISQSNVILLYLADALGRFDGATPPARLELRQWLGWEQDMLWNTVLARRAVCYLDAEPAVVAFFQRRAGAALKLLDRHLEGREFIVGAAPTIADIACYPDVAMADQGGVEVARWPRVVAWAARLAALPGVGAPSDILPKASVG